MTGFLLMSAPLQGFTEAPFRHFHSEIYGEKQSHVTYYTPFLRVERGVVRFRDLRDAVSPLNANHNPVPQIIFRDAAEFSMLVDELRSTGHNRIDLNMGCPFIPQVRKGRGAGMIGRTDALREIAILMSAMTETEFSIKMRLGIDSPSEWRDMIGVINEMPLRHVTVHPRTASQQYSGALHVDEFRSFVEECRHPVVFNGDIVAPEQIDGLCTRLPGLAGVMAGRGLLMRPSLFAEWRERREWTRDERVAGLLKLHSKVFDHYCSTLTGGDAQILTKIKPMWDYFGAEFDRKAVKKIVKAGSMANYRIAVTQLS